MNLRLLALALLLLAGGCGQKGPLYLPEPPDEPPSENSGSGE